MSDKDVVIRVEGLGKRYSLHHQQPERYRALRDSIAHRAKVAGKLLNPFTLAGQLGRSRQQAAQELAASEEEFWALKDVSFEIRRGERVGIIGRNGAGKSTLLKILSRITEPTTGRIELRGRVASLLEVGTGFHPELTGRENIYLNGAILGMTRREIRAKFDEIVAFAEVEKFLDTPVKRYSSGMYVRLAFAVAAHLEPEILVVDEVLAVGDANFQQKCLGKMKDIGESEDRTILFVSHNLAMAQALCSAGLVFSRGRLVGNYQDISTAIFAYTEELNSNTSKNNIRNRSIKSNAWITDVWLCSENEIETNSFLSGDMLGIAITYNCYLQVQNLEFNIGVYDHMREKILHLSSSYCEFRVTTLQNKGQVICWIKKLPLLSGNYTLNLSLFNGSERVDHIRDAINFVVEPGKFYSSGKLPTFRESKFLVEIDWHESQTLL
ncbi:ABC transporter ATP-binding protein [Synechococcus elongatus IITB4]|uniref:ABC transporter ATP-binding protein n=1 Tax=Synechococcus elongatus TaxID=32046 RepID=UPI0030D5C01A